MSEHKEHRILKITVVLVCSASKSYVLLSLVSQDCHPSGHVIFRQWVTIGRDAVLRGVVGCVELERLLP